LRIDRAYSRFIFELNPGDAEAELLSLQREKPEIADLYVRLSLVQASVGRVDEALCTIREAEAADSLLAPLAFVSTALYLFRGDFEQAVVSGRNAVELHPSSPVGRADYAAALEFSGRLDEALGQHHLASSMAPDLPWIRAREGMCLVKSGRAAEASEILDELQRQRETEYVDAYHLAALSAVLNQREAALVELKRAYQEKSWSVSLLEVDPKAEALRGLLK
jgi:tetratricopeptide (TPR) repeat protein